MHHLNTDACSLVATLHHGPTFFAITPYICFFLYKRVMKYVRIPYEGYYLHIYSKANSMNHSLPTVLHTQV